MRAVTPPQSSWRWLPDMAANLLAVSMVALTLVALMPAPDKAAGHRQTPQGPAALVDALWARLHPGVTVYDLDETGLHPVSERPDPTQPALLFVLSHVHYDQAAATLQGQEWIEITVPEALATPAGWRQGFLALANSGASRDGFEARLAALLHQGAGDVMPRGQETSASPALWPRLQTLVFRLSNLLGCALGLFALLWLMRRRALKAGSDAA